MAPARGPLSAILLVLVTTWAATTRGTSSQISHNLTPRRLFVRTDYRRYKGYGGIGILSEVLRVSGGQRVQEDKPLDAYMRGIDEQLKKEEAEGDDAIELDKKGAHFLEGLERSDSPGFEYMRYRKKRGLDVYVKGSIDTDQDSEEIMRRQQKEAEENAQKEEKEKSDEHRALEALEENPDEVWKRKRKVKPLKFDEEGGAKASLFVSKYPIAKNIYNPLWNQTSSSCNTHCAELYKDARSILDLKRPDETEIEKRREELEIRVEGFEIQPPEVDFETIGLPKEMLAILKKRDFTGPMPIQSQCIPIALTGRDLIGVAPTGTGKTLGFVIPMGVKDIYLILHVRRNYKARPMDKRRGPIGMVVAPTRELATQITTEAMRMAKPFGLVVKACYGGQSKAEQQKSLSHGVDIIVCTPGRMMDLIKIKATSMVQISFLVFDEADRLLDSGFEYQVRSMLERIRPDRQVLLFGATIPPAVQHLAEETVCRPVKVSIGAEGQGAHNRIKQQYVLVRDAKARMRWLLHKIEGMIDEGEVLIFCTQREKVEEVAKHIEEQGHRVCHVHSGIDPNQRKQMVMGYKEGSYTVMVGSDLVARGLDIRNIKSVVCFEPPRDLASHVHRIGRTARGNEREGIAYTLLTRQDSKFCAELVQWMEQVDVPINSDILTIACKDKSFKRNQKDFLQRIQAKLSAEREELRDHLIANGEIGAEQMDELIDGAQKQRKGKSYPKFSAAAKAAAKREREGPEPDLGGLPSGDSGDEDVDKRAKLGSEDLD